MAGGLHGTCNEFKEDSGYVGLWGIGSARSGEAVAGDIVGLGRSEHAPTLAPLVCALLFGEYLPSMLARAASSRWAAGEIIFLVSQGAGDGRK